MKAIILEDENSAVKNLTYLLNIIAPDIIISQVIESVSDAIPFLETNDDFDLVFMDIHLADGNSFEIFHQVRLNKPIIFITAFDQYAIQAFKVNGIDYLLKPIQKQELFNAIQKVKNQTIPSGISAEQINRILKEKPKKYIQSFLVKKKDAFIPVPAKEFALFYIENGNIKGITFEQSTFYIEGKVEDLDANLDPTLFFRLNRQSIISRAAIKSLNVHFNGRMIVKPTIPLAQQLIVSKATVPKLKDWIINN